MTRIHRGKMQITRDILYALQHTDTTTHLVYHANTTDQFVKRILPHLERQGLVTCTMKRKGFETHLTEKGRALIQQFRLVDDALQLETYQPET